MLWEGGALRLANPIKVTWLPLIGLANLMLWEGGALRLANPTKVTWLPLVGLANLMLWGGGPGHLFGPDDQPARSFLARTPPPQVCQTESTRERPERKLPLSSPRLPEACWNRRGRQNMLPASPKHPRAAQEHSQRPSGRNCRPESRRIWAACV